MGVELTPFEFYALLAGLVLLLMWLSAGDK